MRHTKNLLIGLGLALGAILGAGAGVPASEPDAKATIVFDSSALAQSVRKSLGEPSRFDWESVKVRSLDVHGGSVSAEVVKNGDAASVHVHGSEIFAVTAKGEGDRKSKLDITFALTNLDANVSLKSRQAEVDATVRVANRESCRVWTRAKNHRTSPWSRITFRVTAIPKPFEVALKMRVRVSVAKDGTITLVPLSWSPTNAKDKVDVKISGQNLPDGWVTIVPLDTPTVKVNMDIPFGVGDRTISNPLRDALGKVIGREFTLGKISP
jgi:hypothetical protein